MTNWLFTSSGCVWTKPTPVAERSPLDRWILSRVAATAATVTDRLADYDSVGAARAISTFIDDLSTWFCASPHLIGRVSRRGPPY